MQNKCLIRNDNGLCLSFVKYKNVRVIDVLAKHKYYIKWCIETLDTFCTDLYKEDMVLYNYVQEFFPNIRMDEYLNIMEY